MKLFTAIMLLASVASAQIKPYTGTAKQANPDYSEHYTVDGAQASGNDALLAAAAGKEVFHCVRQEASFGKSGKNISIKNVKKNK